jgi:hypothetical protein
MNSPHKAGKKVYNSYYIILYYIILHYIILYYIISVQSYIWGWSREKGAENLNFNYGGMSRLPLSGEKFWAYNERKIKFLHISEDRPARVCSHFCLTTRSMEIGHMLCFSTLDHREEKQTEECINATVPIKSLAIPGRNESYWTFHESSLMCLLSFWI